MLRLIFPICLVVLTSSPLPTARSEAGRRTGRAPLFVIVQKDDPARDLSLSELRDLFFRRSAGRLRPLNLPAKSEARVAFDRRVSGISPDDTGRYWINRKIRGEKGPPKSIPSERLMVRIIGRVPNTIGYVRGRDLPPSVKVVRINGKKPSERGYPLYIEKESR